MSALGSVIDILLVDDEQDFLEEVTDALKYQRLIPYQLNIVGQADTGEKALEMARNLQPDLIIMDLVMPGLDGLEIAKILLPELPQAKVLILSSHLDFKDVHSVVQAGVRGYLLKGNIMELIRGIEKVYRDEPVFPQEVIHSLFRQQFTKKLSKIKLKPKKTAQTELLSGREKEILSLSQSGYSRGDIADKLQLSLSTVRTYLSRIDNKT